MSPRLASGVSVTFVSRAIRATRSRSRAFSLRKLAALSAEVFSLLFWVESVILSPEAFLP